MFDEVTLSSARPSIHLGAPGSDVHSHGTLDGIYQEVVRDAALINTHSCLLRAHEATHFRSALRSFFCRVNYKQDEETSTAAENKMYLRGVNIGCRGIFKAFKSVTTITRQSYHH